MHASALSSTGRKRQPDQSRCDKAGDGIDDDDQIRFDLVERRSWENDDRERYAVQVLLILHILVVGQEPVVSGLADQFEKAPVS